MSLGLLSHVLVTRTGHVGYDHVSLLLKSSWLSIAQKNLQYDLEEEKNRKKKSLKSKQSKEIYILFHSRYDLEKIAVEEENHL